jgi:hypothetical protein
MQGLHAVQGDISQVSDAAADPADTGMSCKGLPAIVSQKGLPLTKARRDRDVKEAP